MNQITFSWLTRASAFITRIQKTRFMTNLVVVGLAICACSWRYSFYHKSFQPSVCWNQGRRSQSHVALAARGQLCTKEAYFWDSGYCVGLRIIRSRDVREPIRANTSRRPIENLWIIHPELSWILIWNLDGACSFSKKSSRQKHPIWGIRLSLSES